MIAEMIQATAQPDSVDKIIAVWMRVQSLLVDPTNLLVVFLFAVGLVLKQSKHVPDWVIIFAVPLIGGVTGYAMFDVGLHKIAAIQSVMLGFVYGVGATFFHACLKNLLESPFGATLLKIPLIPVLAGLMGVEMRVETPTVPPPASTPQSPK